MGRRRIGIPGYVRNDMFGVHPDYLHFVEEFGTPIIIPPVDRKEFFHRYKIDGLVLPGGADVSPWRYAKNALHGKILERWRCFPADPALEHFDTEILPGLAHAGFPIFGICRGLQTLNVHFGGSLRNVDYHPQSMFKTDLLHSVRTASEAFPVNSFHHQAIGRLAEGFNVAASTSDGIIEAVIHQTMPIFAVQWHPERFDDKWSRKMAEKLFA